MTPMLWYPQLDVYDSCRRLLLIVGRRGKLPLAREQIYIADFYLSNPVLLHRTRMTKQVRDRFRELHLPRDGFVTYPPPPVLFEKMSGVQSEALQNLIGRGLLELEALRRDGNLQLSALGQAMAPFARVNDPIEEGVLNFICESFLTLVGEAGGLRGATGLRRIGL